MKAQTAVPSISTSLHAVSPTAAPHTPSCGDVDSILIPPPVVAKVMPVSASIRTAPAVAVILRSLAAVTLTSFCCDTIVTPVAPTMLTDASAVEPTRRFACNSTSPLVDLSVTPVSPVTVTPPPCDVRLNSEAAVMLIPPAVDCIWISATAWTLTVPSAPSARISTVPSTPSARITTPCAPVMVAVPVVASRSTDPAAAVSFTESVAD